VQTSKNDNIALNTWQRAERFVRDETDQFGHGQLAARSGHEKETAAHVPSLNQTCRYLYGPVFLKVLQFYKRFYFTGQAGTKQSAKKFVTCSGWMATVI